MKIPAIKRERVVPVTPTIPAELALAVEEEGDAAELVPVPEVDAFLVVAAEAGVKTAAVEAAAAAAADR